MRILLLPVAPKFLSQRAIANTRFRQPLSEMFFFKVRMARRGGKCAYIGEKIDLMLFEEGNELFQRSR